MYFIQNAWFQKCFWFQILEYVYMHTDIHTDRTQPNLKFILYIPYTYSFYLILYNTLNGSSISYGQ